MRARPTRPLAGLAAALLLSACGPTGTVTTGGQRGTAHGEAPFAPGRRTHLMPPFDPNGLTAAPASTQLSYYGGPVISSVKIVAVWWGSSVSTAVKTGMPAFYAAFTQSPMFDWLNEYDTNIKAVGGTMGTGQTIGPGRFLEAVTITPSVTGTSLTDAQIQTELNAQISAGNLPAPDADTLYMIHFPAGVSITAGTSKSCTAFCGYHGTFTRSGQDVYYAVMPSFDPGAACNTACAFTSNPLDSLTLASSHEIVEAVTDAAVGLAKTYGPPLAWYDQASSTGEIGDICAGKQGSFTDPSGKTWTVQKEWSNQAQSCVDHQDAAGPASDFAISLVQPSVVMGEGDAQWVSVTTTASGTPEQVTLSVGGLPPGVTGTFKPATVTAGQGATLALQSTAGAPPIASAPFTVTGTATSGTHAAGGTLTVTGGGPTSSGGALENGVPLTGLSSATHTYMMYTLTVPPGSSNLKVSIAGGTGDADLEVTYGNKPAAGDYDCKPLLKGNNETCTLGTVKAGVYYVSLYANAAYAGVTLLGSFTAPPSDGSKGFTMSLSNTSVTLPQGGSVEVTLHTSGPAVPATLDVAGGADNVSVGYTSPITIGDSVSMRLSAGADTPVTSGSKMRIYVKTTAVTHYRTLTVSVVPAKTTGNTATGNFTMTLDPAQVTLAPGATTRLTVHTTDASGNGGAVDLHVPSLPTGVTATFAPATVTAGQDATLTLSAAAAAPAMQGASFRVYGESGTYLHYRTGSVTVTAGSGSTTSAGDFSLTLSSASVALPAGGTATLTVTTAPAAGASPGIALHVPTLPAGVTATFAPATLTAGGTSTLTLTAAGTATTTGSVAFRVYGQSSDHIHYRVADVSVH